MGNWGEETLWGYTYELYGPLLRPLVTRACSCIGDFSRGCREPGQTLPKTPGYHFPYFQSILMGVGMGMGGPTIGNSLEFSLGLRGANGREPMSWQYQKSFRKFQNRERFGATPPGFQAYRRYLEANSKRTWKLMVGRHLFGKASWQVLVLGSVFGFIKDQYMLPSLQTFAEIASHLEESIRSSWKIYSNMFWKSGIPTQCHPFFCESNLLRSFWGIVDS